MISKSSPKLLMLALPVNHPIRLEALADTRLLDSLPEESYDRFTRLACSILDAEVSLISLVDKDRQYFKSEYGLGEPLRTTRQNDISYSFCRYVVEGGEPFVVEDAMHDPRVNLNPAVKELGVAAYVGMPISTPDGCILGSLCAVQMVPRKWSISDLKNLSDLADAVCREVELTEQAIALQHTFRLMENRRLAQERDLRDTVHDLRTPAGAISSCLELMNLSDENFTQDTRELIELSQSSVTTLLDMIQELLVRGKLKSKEDPALTTQSVSASLILRRVARIVRPFAYGAKVKLDLEWPDDLILLNVDERLIERVFLNILTNAVKFSPAESSVKIRLRNTDESDRPMCRISVIDQGPGVPDAEKGHIFGEFSTGSIPSAHGLPSFGIGLSFCKTVVESHGGKIGVEDAPGGGSEFYCLLPCID